MTDWRFRFPTKSHIPRDLAKKMKRSYSAIDVQSIASVSVYCEEESHAGDPWLIGSFVPNEDLLAQGRLHWAFHPDYPTGDGHMVRVGSGDMKVSLVDSRVIDWASLTPAEKTDISPDLRGRYRPRCEHCGLARSAREESMNSAITGLYAAGIREVKLSVLILALELLKDSPPA
jgi:hypothetical protein